MIIVVGCSTTKKNNNIVENNKQQNTRLSQSTGQRTVTTFSPSVKTTCPGQHGNSVAFLKKQPQHKKAAMILLGLNGKCKHNTINCQLYRIVVQSFWFFSTTAGSVSSMDEIDSCYGEHIGWIKPGFSMSTLCVLHYTQHRMDHCTIMAR